LGKKLIYLDRRCHDLNVTRSPDQSLLWGWHRAVYSAFCHAMHLQLWAYCHLMSKHMHKKMVVLKFKILILFVLS
jgi:hypothetical protein